MDVLLRLQKWYADQCDGDWEHQYGVHVGMLDNPGWQVDIDLTDTDLEGRAFAELAEGLGETGHQENPRWIRCWVNDGMWQGRSDETLLARQLLLFLEWAAADEAPDVSPGCSNA